MHQLGIDQKHRISNAKSPEQQQLENWAITMRSQVIATLQNYFPTATKQELNQMLATVGAVVGAPMQVTQSPNQTPIQMAPLSPQDMGIHPDAPEVAALSLNPQYPGWENVAPMKVN